MARAHLGLSDEEMADFSPRALETTVLRFLHRKASAPSGVPVVTPAPNASPEPEIDLGLDESQYDEKLLGAIKKIGKENVKLRSEIDAREKAREAEEHGRRIDKHFKKYETTLGKGRGIDMDHASPTFQRRVALLNAAYADQSSGSLEDKIDRAHAALFGAGGYPAPPAAEPEPAKTRNPASGRFTADDFNNGATAKPTQRQADTEPKGVAKAKKAFLAGIKARGLDQETEDGDTI